MIGTVISYCTNDYRFISKCIEEAKVFSKQILVVVCDHFFNGQRENRVLLESTYASHPDCQFIEFSYCPDRIYSKYHTVDPASKDWAIYWAATTRYIGLQYLDPEIERVLFLDSDEIVEGARFLEWFESGIDQEYEVMRFGSYYYAIRANLQSELCVNLPLIVAKDRFQCLTLLNGLERIGAYRSHIGPKREYVLGLDQKPLVHHYSWVRTKEEALQKGRTWGHSNEADWDTLIEDAFQLKNIDRIFGSDHTFKRIDSPYFDPLSVQIPKKYPSTLPNNQLKITDRDLFRKEIENEFI